MKAFDCRTELMVIWYIPSVSHSIMPLFSCLLRKRVSAVTNVSLLLALFFKLNAIDQQQSFLKLVQRYEPIKAPLFGLNMIGKENCFHLDLYLLAFYCNPLLVTFHYTPPEDIFSSFYFILWVLLLVS